MNRISCPNCKTVLQASAEQAGMGITCPNCQGPIDVPKEEAATAQALAGNAGSPPPMPVVEQWFFNRNGIQQGPVTAEQLRGMITPNDLVWKQGLPQWAPASTFPNLFSVASPSSNMFPPPMSPGSGGNVQPGAHNLVNINVPWAPGLGGNVEPHRSGMILTLGILSLFFSCTPLGLIAWILGGSDLSKMSVGTMDRSGHGATLAGYICGIISTIFIGVVLVSWFCLFVLGALGLAIAR